MNLIGLVSTTGLHWASIRWTSLSSQAKVGRTGSESVTAEFAMSLSSVILTGKKKRVQTDHFNSLHFENNWYLTPLFTRSNRIRSIPNMLFFRQ